MANKAKEMTFEEQLLKAHEENKCLALLAIAALRGNRVVATGEIAEGLLMMVPDLLFFEKRSISDEAVFKNLQADDVLIVENQNVDSLWRLSSQTPATIIHIAEHELDKAICDLEIQEKDLRSAILSLGRLVANLKSIQIGNELATPKTVRGLFLDRDGVIIEDVGYAKSAAQVVLVDGIVDLIQRARKNHFKVIVVTNQSGIARGTISFSQYDEVNARMMELLAEQGQYVDQVVKASFYEKAARSIGLLRRSFRKPRSGMLVSVIEEQRIDVSRSIMVGDTAKDLMAASLAGVESLYLIETEKEKDQIRDWKNWPLLSRAMTHSKMEHIKSLNQIKI